MLQRIKFLETFASNVFHIDSFQKCMLKIIEESTIHLRLKQIWRNLKK